MGPEFRRVVCAVVTQQLFLINLGGLLLNVCGVPLPEMLGTSLRTVGSVFKPSMYFFVGILLSTAAQYGLVEYFSVISKTTAV